MILAHNSPVEHGVLVAAGALAVGLYGWAWLRRPNASTWRLASWSTGIATVLIALIPAMERWAQRSFTGHMVQHLMIITIAAPLLVLSAPIETLRRLPWMPRRTTATERIVARWWRASAGLPAAVAFLGVLYLTHLTAIYNEALGNNVLHDVEHVAYLGSAVLLWAAITGRGRRAGPARMGVVFAVIGGSAILGMVLISASAPLVPTYEQRLGFAAALNDQRLAASLMWVAGMATTLPLLIFSVWNWAATEQRIALRAEALADGLGS